MKMSTNIRYKNSWIDFCGDGRFPKERIKGKDKRLLGKWSRKKIRKEIENNKCNYNPHLKCENCGSCMD